MRFSAAEALLRSGIDPAVLAAELTRVDPSRVPVCRAPWIMRKLWAGPISAMALPWGIYLAPELLSRPMSELGPLMVHELTHIEQWRRLGPIGWTKAYLGDYLRSRRAGSKHFEAYRAVGLEVEARAHAARFKERA